MTKMIIKVDNNDINWINSFNAYYDSTFTIGQEIEREDVDQFQKMADDFIRDMQSKGGIDAAIKKMTEAVREGKDLLPDVSPALKATTGRGR